MSNIVWVRPSSLRRRCSDHGIFGVVCKLAFHGTFCSFRKEQGPSWTGIIAPYLGAHGTVLAWGSCGHSLSHLWCFMPCTLFVVSRTSSASISFFSWGLHVFAMRASITCIITHIFLTSFIIAFAALLGSICVLLFVESPAVLSLPWCSEMSPHAFALVKLSDPKSFRAGINILRINGCLPGPLKTLN